MSVPPPPLPLPERLVLDELPALVSAIEAHRALAPAVALDASAVRDVDGAALQFLLVWRAACTAAGEASVLVGLGEPLERAFADIGVEARSLW